MPQALMLAANFRSLDRYIDSCVALAQEKLPRFATMSEIAGSASGR